MAFLKCGRHWLITHFWLCLSLSLQHLSAVCTFILSLYDDAPVWWLPSPESILWPCSSSLTHSSTEASQWCRQGQKKILSVFAFAWIGFKASFFSGLRSLRKLCKQIKTEATYMWEMSREYRPFQGWCSRKAFKARAALGTRRYGHHTGSRQQRSFSIKRTLYLNNVSATDWLHGSQQRATPKPSVTGSLLQSRDSLHWVWSISTSSFSLLKWGICDGQSSALWMRGSTSWPNTHKVRLKRIKSNCIYLQYFYHCICFSETIKLTWSTHPLGRGWGPSDVWHSQEAFYEVFWTQG